MIEEGKEIILKLQDIIDIILENQNNYAIDRDIMLKLDEYFKVNSELFDNKFIVNYLNFIGLFNPFFDFLLDKLVNYENILLERKEIIDDCFFVFNFNEFSEKDILQPYSEITNCLEEMFPKNALMQGVIFYLHLNILLKKHMFNNNRIRVVNQIPVVDIDYGKLENTGDLTVIDVPLTLSAAYRSVELALGVDYIGIEKIKELAKEKELNNFIKTVNNLILEDIYTRKSVSVRKVYKDKL